MKNIQKICLFSLIGVLTFFTSCKEDLPFLEPETAVHGLSQFKPGSTTNFVFGDPNSQVDIQLQWISIDKKNEVEKIEVFVNFNENYVDSDGNPKVARHGGTTGKGDATLVFTGMANRTFKDFSITQDFVYNLYKDAKFDYGDGEVSVFSNPGKPDRSPSSRFVPGDEFSITWKMTLKDGRIFDTWSPSVCTEFPGASCSQAWKVVCVSEDLSGVLDYVQTNMTGGAGVPTPIPAQITGSVTWTKGADGRYSSTDITFGHFPDVWGDNPVTNPKISEACGKITVEGADQYGDTYTYTISNISGATMTVTWINTYGDGGKVVLTRQDGKNWPNLR